MDYKVTVVFENGYTVEREIMLMEDVLEHISALHKREEHGEITDVNIRPYYR